MIGKRIQSLLELRGMKQKELAAKIGVTEVTISRYINGERDPQLEILVRMAEVLQASTDYLLNKSLSPNLPESFSGMPQTKSSKLTDAEVDLIQFIREAFPDLTPEQYQRKLELVKLSVKFVEEMEKKG